MGSVSKKAKKESPVDSGISCSETESELPTEDDSKYPDDLEDKMKGEGVSGHRCPEGGAAVSQLKTEGSFQCSDTFSLQETLNLS